jgi:glycosyltransferase involved in cell wall biosynthesis
MASGLPCVIADGGGSRNFIQQGQNGFLCQPNNAEDYLNHISTLIHDTRLHQQFVAEGLHYSKSLSWDDLAATYFKDLTAIALQSGRTHE